MRGVKKVQKGGGFHSGRKKKRSTNFQTLTEKKGSAVRDQEDTGPVKQKKGRRGFCEKGEREDKISR